MEYFYQVYYRNVEVLGVSRSSKKELLEKKSAVNLKLSKI